MPPTLQSVALIGLGLTPSLVWLSFYIKKDCHPEPRSLLAKTFLMGIIISPLAILLQLGFSHFLSFASQIVPGISQGGSSFFLWAAGVEELIKFYAVRILILRSPDFDEPIDAMIYMIAAGLGFAAMENILVMFNVYSDGAQATFGTWSLRFAGATLLHALASGIMGYFLAMSWFFREHAKKLIIVGFIIATIFHFTFNIFIASFGNRLTGLTYSTSLLVIMAFLVSVLFDKIKERHRGPEAKLTISIGDKAINLLG